MTSQYSPAAANPSDIATTNPMLNIVGEKFLPSSCRRGTLSYCPTMDLVAIVTVLDIPGLPGHDGDGRTAEKLSVWRLNGQQVFAWDAPAGLGIMSLRWKGDGRLIAVGTTDGAIRLCNVMSGGKVVHSMRAPAIASALSCLSWAVNFGDVKGLKGLLGGVGKRLTLDELLSLGTGKDAMARMKADFPRELACGIDVETSIPKLSLLPPGTGGGGGGGWGYGGGGGDEEVFSTRASLDAIFHSYNTTSGKSSRHDEIDVLLTGFEDGTLYIRIFDCFDIGKVDLSSSLPKDSKTCKVIHHAAHPLSSRHALIVQTSTKNYDAELHVVALDLNFIPQTSPYYLSTLATKSTQLLNLLRYLTQTSTHLSIELRGAFELPGKFIRNINETLSRSPGGPIDFVTAAYQLVVTGDCSDEVRDWLVDEVGERNIKRWEKASALGMENIRRLVHECLLPAVERCQVVLSRLEGLSRFAKSAQALGLDTQCLHRVMETVECLNLLGHYLLKTVGKEIKQFTAFMKWLRLEVEIQGLEKENAGGPGSERLDEVCLRRDEVESITVLDYIQGVMGKSGISAFVRPSVDARGSSLDGPAYDWSQNDVDVGFYDVFKTMLKTSSGPGRRPDLEDLLRRLTGQAQKVFDEIAQTLRKSILHSRVCTLPSDCAADFVSARMVLSAEEGYKLVLATKKKTSANGMSLHCIPWEILHRTQTPEVRSITIPDNEAIVDMKFIDDSEMMVLCSGEEQAHLYTLNYTHRDLVWQERHTLDRSSGGDGPSELEVNGRKGRRAVCILEDDIRFTVFDLDSGLPDEEGPVQDEDVMMVE